MAINKIIKFKLESQAIALREDGRTFDEIATILTEDSKQTISKSNVFRYFNSHEKAMAVAIGNNPELSEKAAEAEINTITDRLEDIKFLSDLALDAKHAGDFRAASLAMKIKCDARDGLDRRLGRITNNGSNVTINNINAMKLSDIPTEDLLRMVNATTQ